MCQGGPGEPALDPDPGRVVIKGGDEQQQVADEKQVNTRDKPTAPKTRDQETKHGYQQQHRNKGRGIQPLQVIAVIGGDRSTDRAQHEIAAQ